MPAETYHTPVLLQDVLLTLVTKPDGVYVDATLGGGGHAEALLGRLGTSARLVGIDADAEALAFARRRLSGFGEKVAFVHDNFGNLASILDRNGIRAIAGILFDLGVSSHQLDEAPRGFSFRADEPLDMRMDQRQERDAAIVVNTLGQQELKRLLSEYGEERQAGRIAGALVRARETSRIRTTGEVAAIVRRAVGEHHVIKSLARVFQALRIEVNRELEALPVALASAIDQLEPGGRLVVISYHSLEDRIVKQTLRSASAASRPGGSRLLPPESLSPRLRILTPSPVTASDEEIVSNPRARSAKLRAAERLAYEDERQGGTGKR